MTPPPPPRTLVAVVGATATGKTDLGEELAAAIGGEVVCADARQVFRELEIGTGKPAPSQRARRPHHLFEALALEDRPSAGWYARAASEACEDIFVRGRTPVLVGGSGLYLRALLEGLHPEPPHDSGVRARLQQELAQVGPEVLHARLATVDPVTAARLAPRDRQRITRALEVHETSGRPLSWWHAQSARAGLDAQARVLELTCGAAALAERIAQRTRSMFAGGLLEEVRALCATGREPALAALHAIGYDEALEVVRGGLTRELAEERTSHRTRQLAKRQRTWFRHQVDALRLAGDGETAKALASHARDALRLTPRREVP